MKAELNPPPRQLKLMFPGLYKDNRTNMVVLALEWSEGIVVIPDGSFEFGEKLSFDFTASDPDNGWTYLPDGTTLTLTQGEHT